jgi:DNA polymerase-3 subunit beta
MLPIYEGVLLEYYGLDVLHLTATDGQTTLTERVAVGLAGTKPWRLVVPMATLLPLVKNLPDQPLTCSIIEGENPHGYGPGLTRLHVATHNGLFKNACLDVTDWPQVAKETTEPLAIRLHVGELEAGLSATVPVVSHDELRPAMTGVLVEVTTDELRLVATDGHRLNVWTIKAGQDVDTVQRFVIPGASAKLLLKMLQRAAGDFELKLTQGTALVEMIANHAEGWSWQTRLIDERYPDYQNVIPISQPNKLLVQRKELHAAVNRTRLYAGEKTVRLLLEEKRAGGELEVWARDFDFDRESHEQLSAHYEGSRMEIGFNSAFLLEELNLVPGAELQLEFSTPGRACIISGSGQAPGAPELMALIMPVLLTNQF